MSDIADQRVGRWEGSKPWGCTALASLRSDPLGHNRLCTYLGDVFNDDILKVSLPSKELGEILAFGCGSDGTPHAIPSL
jgi:hypothetical protein